ncbi:MAG: 3-hydroxybutyryl-CoA dehydrogenase [Bacteroidales bacterium]|jgi:3-hydroxybutyryl-CoA dehydrogenase|nr:3-hydroxybutyryl-CoA dehydrogenase [Bacteroidales bacterium]
METIGVVGAGTMGCGIVLVFLNQGFRVVLNDLNETLINKGVDNIGRYLSRSVEKGKISGVEKDEILSRLTASDDINSLNRCDLVVEAVTEDMEVKTGLFKKLDEICSNETILASNTSSLSITAVSNATSRPDKVIGMHFFNPAPVNALVELIKGLNTSSDTYDRVFDLVIKIGKTPVSVQESPGFIVNRLLIPMINEAVYLLAEGVAEASEIDKAMKLGAGHPMGPLALADFIGLDVTLAIMENLHNELGDDKYRPCPLLKKMVRGGMLGKKTKLGFFTY